MAKAHSVTLFRRARRAAPGGAVFWPSARGSVTAEFAIVLPAVVLVLALCLCGVAVTAQQVRLQDVAADAARILGRGESLVAAERYVETRLPGTTLSAELRESAVCVHLALPIAMPGASVLALTTKATSCALAGGL